MKSAKIVLRDIRRNWEVSAKEVVRPLSDNFMQELMNGDYLSGDHINNFNDILGLRTNYMPQNVFFIGALEFVQPVFGPHIQILSSNPTQADQITHWICTFYDGTSVHVYDSLNLQRLSKEQHEYLFRLHLRNVPILYERVQQQPNMVDCGLFAIAFATSIANNRDPIRETYDHSQMRNHLRQIYLTSQLDLFPSCYNLPDSEKGVKKRGRPKKMKNYKYNIENKKKPLQRARQETNRLTMKNIRDTQSNRHKQSRLLRNRTHVTRVVIRENITTPEKQSRLLRVRKSASEIELGNRKGSPKNKKRTMQCQGKDDYLLEGEKGSKKRGRPKKKAEDNIKKRKQSLAKENLRKETNRSRMKKKRDVQTNTHKPQSRQEKYGRTARGKGVGSHSEHSTEEHYIGEMNVRCEFCGSKNFLSELPQDKEFTTCCQKGKVNLNSLSPPPFPTFLENLMTGNDPDSKNFTENIRSYNSAFSFVSMGARIEAPRGLGPYCFRIHGQIYHRAVNLHPADGEQRKYAQLYILDPEEATRQRMNITENSACKKRIMEKLSNFMCQNNELAKAYKMLHEVEKESLSEAKAKGIPPENVTMAIRYDRSSDLRRYNAPRVNEVAIVFQNADGEPPFERDLIIHLTSDAENREGSKTQRISVLHPSLEPMTYPLLFPFGNSGWHSNIPMVVHSNGEKEAVNAPSRTRVTQMAYYGYRLAVRDGFNQFLSAGKLTQQFLVDSYVKTESNRLKWIRDHQKELHAESYQGLMDHLHSRSAEKGLTAGKPIILPSTFIGSPRNMQQHYQDAMSIVRKYGKPDLFITMTCNPKWTEITQNLQNNEKVEHRPDLVARVFDIKLKELLNDMCKKQVLGKIIANIHVVEFQKRGLPHAHMLFILADEDKPRDSEVIDSIVSAEIPDPVESPRLHQIVLKNMIHGPCGTLNSRSPCMEDGKCSKDFPKDFQPETISNLNGYPRYRRSDDGRKFVVAGSEVDNRWTVPYNPYLSLKFNCHINVEVCATVKSVKYLFKYVYKGHDCANIEIAETDHDEVKQFMDARYVSAPEAAWRLFAKPMHQQSHAIIRLAIHLPGHQMVYFDPNAETGAVLEASAFSDTTLIAWFRLNTTNEKARGYLYHEIPEHFVFQKKSGWKERKRGGHKVIGRMYTVSVAEGERYFLRLLLLHVRGAKSFQDLRTVDNIVYDSFKEAARKSGLLEDDQVWEDTLKEAVLVGMPSPLRQLFAFICVFGTPLEPRKLWDTYIDSFTEDFVRKHNEHTSECSDCENLALTDVNSILILHGRKCEDFGLKKPHSNLQQNMQDTFDMQQEENLGKDMYLKLNSEQKLAFDTVMNAIYKNKNSSNCFFLDGPGGSGKTHLYKTLLSVIRGKGDVALPVASTGIAANLLKGGRTYHSLYKLPVPLLETSVSNMRMASNEAAVIREAKLLIWDESTMAPSHALNAVNRLLQDIMCNKFPFGGKVLLLGGDFRQCLPVVPHAPRAAIVQSCIKYSEMWKEFKILRLQSNVRAVDTAYSEWLMKLGDGDLTSDHGEDMIEVPQEISTQGSIVQLTYGERLSLSNISNFNNTAILCPKNEDVAKINEEVLSILEGVTKCYVSVDSIDCEDEKEKENYPVEFLHSLTPSGMPPHLLNLKLGSAIMLLRNLNTRQGLCNGTRLSVTRLDQNVIHAKILTGSSEGKVCFIPRIDLAPSDPSIPFVLRRRQFPVKLAFSITINKSQGQTMDRVGLYLPQPVFSHGQLYVACSRVRRYSDIKIKINDGPNQGKFIATTDSVYTKNIVYKEIL